MENTIAIVSIVATLIASFTGAWFAFYFHDRKEKRSEDRKKKAAINKAIFTIFRQYNSLLLIKKNIDPYRDIPIRAFCMLANIGSTYNIELDDKELFFILETIKPDFLFRILVEHERYKQAVFTYDLRTRHHIEEIQPALEKNNLTDRHVSLDEFKTKLGLKLFVSSNKLADSLFEHVYETIESHKKIGLELFDFAKKLYPKDSFIKFEQTT